MLLARELDADLGVARPGDLAGELAEGRDREGEALLLGDRAADAQLGAAGRQIEDAAAQAAGGKLDLGPPKRLVAIMLATLRLAAPHDRSHCLRLVFVHSPPPFDMRLT